MIDTENIAIAILLLGYAPMAYAVTVLWRAILQANDREAAALREGIEIDRNYTAQVDAMSEVITSIQRTQRVAAKAAQAGFARLERCVMNGADKVIEELRQ